MSAGAVAVAYLLHYVYNEELLIKTRNPQKKCYFLHYVYNEEIQKR